jgi:hypothetical protein
MRRRRAAAVEDTGQVHVDHEPPVLGRQLGQRSDLRHTGIVDDDVEPAELADGALDQGVHLGVARHVGGDHDGPPACPRRELGGLLERSLGTGRQSHVGARFRQRHRDGSAEAATGAGDDGDLAGQRAGPGAQR